MMVPRMSLALCGILCCLPAFAETHDVPLFMAASNDLQQGFVRVINHSDAQGTVEVRAVDDAGHSPPAITIALAPNGVVHFNSGDLEQGNAAKGLSGGIGAGSGDWRLTFDSALEIEVLPFVRSWTGFVTPVHDLALVSDTTHYIPTFNPGSNLNQQSKLRMINPGAVAARVTIDALDDGGQRGGKVTVTLDAASATTFTAAELEAGAGGAQGALGDGQGKWRLYVAADQPIEVMTMLEQPDGYLSNLSESRLAEGRLATVLDRLALEDDPDVDPIDDIDLAVPGQCAAEVEVCVRDYACEDGDEARVTVNDSIVFEGELFNRWQCDVVSVNEGVNSIAFLALNGTGFKGACDHSDANTGELRVTARGGDQDLQRWQHRGGKGSRANLNITIAPRNDDACDVPGAGDDHGDTRAEATDLALGGSRQGRLDDSDDEDVFRIQITEAGTLTVHTTGSTDTFGELADSEGTSLATNDDGGGDLNFRIEENVAAGVYFVTVSPYDDGGAYTVHAGFVPDEDHPELDPIDDIDLALPGQCAAEVEVCVRDYSCEDGDEARVTVNDSIVFEGELFNRWQCDVVSVNEGVNSIAFLALNGTGFKGPCDHPDANTGELRVTARGGDQDLQRWRHRGGKGSRANLNITIAPRNEDACDVPGAGDDHGDTRAEATDLALGGSRQGRLDDSDDEDVFRIQITEAGTLTVHTTGSTDTFGELADSEGTTLATNDDGGGDLNFRIEENVAAGVYFVTVSPVRDDEDGGSYTVHAGFVADVGGGGGGDPDGWLGADVGVLNDPLSEIQPTVINGPAGMSVMGYAPIDSWTWRWVRPPRPGPEVPVSPDLGQCVFVGTRDLTVLGPDGMETGSYHVPVVAGPPSAAGLSDGWNYRRNSADEKDGLQILVSGGEVRDVECWANGVELSDGRYENGVPDGWFSNFTNGELDGVGYQIFRDGGRDEWRFHTFRADPDGREPNCGTGHGCGMLHGRTGRYENGVPDGWFSNFTNGELDGVAYQIFRDGGRDEWRFHTFRADPDGREPNCGTGHGCGMLHGRTGRYENGVPHGWFSNFANGELDGVAYQIFRDGGRDEWRFHTFRADPDGREPNCGTGHGCGMLHGRTGRYENGVPHGHFSNFTNGELDGVAYVIYRDGGRDEWRFHTFRADPDGREPNCGTGHGCGMLHGRIGRYENGVRDGWFGSYADGERTGTWIYYVDGEERDRESY